MDPLVTSPLCWATRPTAARDSLLRMRATRNQDTHWLDPDRLRRHFAAAVAPALHALYAERRERPQPCCDKVSDQFHSTSQGQSGLSCTFIEGSPG